MKKFSVKVPLSVLGMTWVVAALSGCNQSVDPSASAPNTQAEQNGQSSAGPAEAVTVEPHELKGDELAAFLKKYDLKAESLPVTKGIAGAGASLKTSAANLCQVNFNSSKGISHMADRAYTYYAVSPYYIEPCFPYYAQVYPSGKNYYYLSTEASNTCSGAYGYMGNWSGQSCVNQKDAALFPRYLAKASPNDGNVIYVVSLLNAGAGATFNAANFFARSGNLYVYAYGANGSYKTWGPIDATSPKIVSLAGATGLIQLGFYATTSTGLFSVDNINIYE